jgi:AcrR family transcriptional regulator
MVTAHQRKAAAAVATEAPDRRQNILLAAEKLFGLRGFHAVSIRDIAAEAGVPLALVGYYFGAKHELYHAIFESWQGSIDQRLAALREAAGNLRAKDTLERILAAWINPLVELARHPEGQYYALMAARDLASPTPESDRAQREFFDPMAHAFIDTLQQVFPAATRGQVAWCYQFMLGAVLHYLTDVRVERLSRGENRATDPAAQTALMRFVAAGFRGALPLR